MKRLLHIRGRIALWCGLLTGTTIVVFATGTLINIYQEQLEAADIELAVEQRHVLALFSTGLTAFESIDRSWTADSGEPWVSFAVFEGKGYLHRATASLPEPVARGALPPGPPRTVRHNGGAWRVQAFPLGEATGVVTFDLQEVHEIVLDLLTAYLLALPLAALVAGWGGWWLAGRALAPVRSLTSEAAAIGPENLDRRVPASPDRDEIGGLASVLNEMLERLERSFRQAERFAGDASHELRTPLTIIGAEVETLLRRQDLSAEAESRLISVQEEIARLARIVDNLLLIARFDAGRVVDPRETPIDFSALLAGLCEDAQILATTRQVSFESRIPPGLAVPGDTDLLHRLVFNLLDNASKHNSPEGKVHCELRSRGDTVELAVENTGPGIPAGFQERLFERFSRADPARSSGGQGLGLALCREIARAHGGDVSFDKTAPAGWTRFVVMLPLARTRRPPPKS